MSTCSICGGELPPLNGVEENDFKSVCDECVGEIADTFEREEM